jgi:hypothetical protein
LICSACCYPRDRQQTMPRVLSISCSSAGALRCSCSVGLAGVRHAWSAPHAALFNGASATLPCSRSVLVAQSPVSKHICLQRPACSSRRCFQAACRPRQRRRSDCRMRPCALDMQKRELLVGDVVCLLCFCFYKQVWAWSHRHAARFGTGCPAPCLYHACPEDRPGLVGWEIQRFPLFHATDRSHHAGASVSWGAGPFALQPGAI